MLTTLEILQNTRAQITNEPETYRYSEWTQCTCGHIYRSASGNFAATNRIVQSTDNGPYHEALLAVLEVPCEEKERLLKFEGYGEAFGTNPASWSLSTLTAAVSNMTLYRAEALRATGAYDELRFDDSGGYTEIPLRDAAVELINEAIEMLEHQQAQAMLDIAGQVDAAMSHVDTYMATTEDYIDALPQVEDEVLIPA